MKCKNCHSDKICKNGKSRNGEQRYRCKICLSSFQTKYRYQAHEINDKQIIILIKESCGIRSISRILNIHPSTVLRKILRIAKTIERPYPILKGRIYEVDEMFTYLRYKKNRVCIAYSFEPKTKHVIGFVVGRRNKSNLKKVTETLILSEAEKIYTDKLNIYRDIIPSEIHSTKNRGINHIERNNLNMRTHIKRLNKKTICYSKNLMMLFAIVKIYFWSI